MALQFPVCDDANIVINPDETVSCTGGFIYQDVSVALSSLSEEQYAFLLGESLVVLSLAFGIRLLVTQLWEKK